MSMTAPSTATSNGCAASSARWTLSSTRSRPSMASAIDTAKPEGRREPGAGVGRLTRPWAAWPGWRLGRLIIGLNLLGLTILIVGALAMNELSKGLINAKIDSLKTQGTFLVNVIEQAATQGEPAPALDPDKARDTLQLLFVGARQRAR